MKCLNHLLTGLKMNEIDPFNLKKNVIIQLFLHFYH